MTRQQTIIAIYIFLAIDMTLLLALVYPSADVGGEAISHTTLPVKQEVSVVQTVKMVDSVRLVKREQFKTGRSVKSVLFSPDKKRLYTLNLEGGSVYEFEQATRKVKRKLIFKQTPAKGYDYETHKWLNNSFEEKPVEGHFTHGGDYLWISLHNAEGIVAWNVKKKELISGKPFRIATIHEEKKKTKINLHFFKTGKTPKVMTSTKDGKYLFVSNWHSHTVSAINIQGDDPSKWKVIKHIPIRPTPRGMCVSEDDKVLYVGLMGSDFLYAVGIDSLKPIKKYTVGNNPRHLLNDGESIYISLSRSEQLVKLGSKDLKEKARVGTKDDPRTICLSPDGSLVFATCYSDHSLQVFGNQKFDLLFSTPSKGKPVGVDVFQEGNIVEAWVGNYTASTLNVFTFEVAYQTDKKLLAKMGSE